MVNPDYKGIAINLKANGNASENTAIAVTYAESKK